MPKKGKKCKTKKDKVNKEFQRAVRRDKNQYSIKMTPVKTSMIKTDMEEQGKSFKKISNSEKDSNFELACWTSIYAKEKRLKEVIEILHSRDITRYSHLQ